MDTKKMGTFLAQLRREHNLTQEQLGEKLGVTNKTVSRWENGNYLPPAEMLQALSELYNVTINEILSGERLTQEAYREKAEENIQSALRESAFTLTEKMEYYERKWDKDHRFSNTMGTVVIFALILLLGFLVEDIGWVLGFLLGAGVSIFRRNQKMIYIEEHAFDGQG